MANKVLEDAVAANADPEDPDFWDAQADILEDFIWGNDGDGEAWETWKNLRRRFDQLTLRSMKK